MGINEILDSIGHDPMTAVLNLGKPDLETYIRHRLSEKAPFKPPLRDPDESPRWFIGDILTYCKGKEKDKVRDPTNYQKVTSVLTDILDSFYPQKAYDSPQKKDEEMRLLSHTLYLCGEHQITQARDTVWNLHKSRAYEGEKSSLGSLKILITGLARCLGGNQNTVEYWKKYFEENADSKDRYAAFSNIYHLDPLQASDEAKEIIDLWKEELLPEGVDAAGTITRYLLELVKRRPGKTDGTDEATKTARNLKEYLLENPVKLSILDAMYDEIEKFDEFRPVFPELFLNK